MSDYEATDSESDYDENEKILLDNYRKKQYDSPGDSEEEVLSVGADDDDLEINDSDIEDQEDDLPNEKAWGKKRQTYYSTDYVDPDYDGYNEKDMQLAAMEGEEAKRLQEKFAQHLVVNDDDFFDILQRDFGDDKITDDLVITDTNKLSTVEKIGNLRKVSPELFSLMKIYKERMNTYITYLKPTISKYRKGQLPDSQAMGFVETYKDLILNYCVNVYMYLLLTDSAFAKLKNHPVVKRLHQYHQLLGKFDLIFEETVKHQIEIVLKEEDSNDNINQVKHTKKKEKKKLKLLEKLLPSEQTKPKKDKKKKEVHFEIDQSEEIIEDQNVEEEEEEMNVDAEIDEENEQSDKRAITYQIAKNKGLTPHRKKEQRNPRVKHRNKFRKAKIRRKGAVREVRNEIQRYGGEISGIKASVSKSIKLKS